MHTSKTIQRKYAASATVGNNAMNPRLKEICVQGHLATEIEEYLCSVAGLPRQLIHVSIGKNVKKKKT
jgi:translation initiation factor 1 (eIF-1/SUI1)